MRFLILLAALFASAPAVADPNGVLFDVAPTSLDLKPGEAGLFFITNHGKRPVTIQIEALDWTQIDGADKLTASKTLFTSPPLAKLEPGARQSIRVLAQMVQSEGEQAYRLRVSELPDPAAKGIGVQVLMQFLVPVFVNHREAPPALAWSTFPEGSGKVVVARNMGDQAVKLDTLAFNGTAVPGGLIYILPGASRCFAAGAGPLHVRGEDARSGKPVAIDLP
ncbi:MAG TPA: fimbria/pilus periplasmic chaperone [Rhizomicrobium sp.]|jgi:fimbrial chaperone protein